MAYANDVGARLRQLRVQQGMSLQDVERDSDGAWKAAVVGSYERGDRNITAAKLCELADFYGVSPAEVLPVEEGAAPVQRSTGLVIDLQLLARLGPEWEGVRRYCESIMAQRGDYNRQMLSIRGEDLRAMAIMTQTTPEGLVDMMRNAAITVEN